MARTETKRLSRSAGEEGFNAMCWHAPACDDAERDVRSACGYISRWRGCLLTDCREKLVELCAENSEIVGRACGLRLLRRRAAVFAARALTSALVGRA